MELLQDEADERIWEGYMYGIIESEVNPFTASEYQEEGDELLANGMCI